MASRMDEIMEMVKTMQIHLDAIEEDRWRGLTPRPNVESDDEEESQPVEQTGKTLGGDQEEELDQVNMLRAISIIGKRPRVDVPNYTSNLNPEELID